MPGARSPVDACPLFQEKGLSPTFSSHLHNRYSGRILWYGWQGSNARGKRRETAKFRGNSIFCAVLALVLALFLPGCTAHKDVADSPANMTAGSGESEPPPEGIGSAGSDGELPDGAPAGMPDGDSDAIWAFDADSDALVSEEITELEEEEEIIDPAAAAADALEACESARIFWEQGDIDEALATLDVAYELLLQIPRTIRTWSSRRKTCGT